MQQIYLLPFKGGVIGKNALFSFHCLLSVNPVLTLMTIAVKSTSAAIICQKNDMSDKIPA